MFCFSRMGLLKEQWKCLLEHSIEDASNVQQCSVKMPKYTISPSKVSFKPYPKSTFYDQLKKVQSDARKHVRSLLTVKNYAGQSTTTSMTSRSPPLDLHNRLENHGLTCTNKPLQDITNINPPRQWRPIYPGAQVNQHESMLMTMKLASRPDVTMTTLSFILDYVKTHMPSSAEDHGNIEHLKSVYKFKQVNHS